MLPKDGRRDDWVSQASWPTEPETDKRDPVGGLDRETAQLQLSRIIYSFSLTWSYATHVGDCRILAV